MKESIVAVRMDGANIGSMLLLTSEFRQEDAAWLAECLELGVVAYAPSLEEAKKELSEAIDLQLNEVDKLGFIDEYLEDHRVHVYPVPNLTSEPEQTWANVGLVGV